MPLLWLVNHDMVTKRDGPPAKRALYGPPTRINTTLATSLPRYQRDLYVLIAALVGFLVAIALMSPLAAYNAAPTEAATIAFIALAFGASTTFAVLSWWIHRVTQVPDRAQDPSMTVVLVVVLLTGFGLRLMQLSTVPIYEDDWFRYLWEGALTAENISPYTTRPADGFTEDLFGNSRAPSTRDDINALRVISEKNDHYAYNVAYPYLSTIYPMGAQTAFALASKIAPMSLLAWRSVLIGADLFALTLLLFFLRLEGRSALWVSLYWLNPLVIITGFNGAHMDVLLTAPMILTCLFVRANRAFFAGLGLGLCAAIKVWPLVLAPLVLRGLMRGGLSFAAIKDQLGRTIALFLLGLIIIMGPSLWPLFTAALLDTSGPTSGFAAYANSWQKNAFLFPILERIVQTIIDAGTLPVAAGFVARILVAGLISLLTIWLAVTMRTPGVWPTMRASFIVITTLVFLAPAGYPWYAIWLALFLPFIPNPGVIALCGTFFLYYARFIFLTADKPDIHSALLVPMEFGLPLMILISLWAYGRWGPHHDPC